MNKLHYPRLLIELVVLHLHRLFFLEKAANTETVAGRSEDDCSSNENEFYSILAYFSSFVKGSTIFIGGTREI